MKLYLDADGGVAGDMLCAGLLALGADADQVLGAMESAGSSLGELSAALEVMPDGVRRLRIVLENNERHLAASRARQILGDAMDNLSLPKQYRSCGMKALEILVEAEREAHRNMPEMDHHIHEQAHQAHHEHHHHHPHHTASGNETYLHEAQDIVMDICGVMSGLWSLGLDPTIELLGPLSVGGGTVAFSHGVLPVPAPAARIILDRYNIPWCFGPIDQELCTPTGVALLAALDARKCMTNPVLNGIEPGRSRGTRAYDIPPLALYKI